MSESAGRLPAHLSARSVLRRGTLVALGFTAAVSVAATAVWPSVVAPAVTTAVALLYLVSTLDRNLLLLRGLGSSALVRVDADEALAIPDDELPVYTVLLPVYDEPTIVKNLINGVRRLDYPADKLEILLLVEEDDIATQTALLDADLQLRAGGDRPAQPAQDQAQGVQLRYVAAGSARRVRDHLRRRGHPGPAPAAARGRRVRSGARPMSVVSKARLGYFNERQNLLTRLFALEYDQWFGVVLPAVQRVAVAWCRSAARRTTCGSACGGTSAAGTSST